jgi:hypothetical protein
VQAEAPVRRLLLACLLLLALALAAYSNSFRGPFLFDDTASIESNPYVRHLWPIWEAMKAPHETSVAGRPIVSLTLAANYAVSGMQVWSYHVVNLLIHVASAWLVFGIARRTFLSAPLRKRFGSDSYALALAIAAIWVVHPLNTMCVTYIVQRAEALMGMCYLLTLYAVIRNNESRHPAMWQVCAVVACLTGMGCKEVMATAPIVVLVYDAIFLSGNTSGLNPR